MNNQTKILLAVLGVVVVGGIIFTSEKSTIFQGMSRRDRDVNTETKAPDDERIDDRDSRQEEGGGEEEFRRGEEFSGEEEFRRRSFDRSPASDEAKQGDVALTSLDFIETQYDGVLYYRVTAGLKNSFDSSSAWKIDISGKDYMKPYTQYMAWSEIPKQTDTNYSFDIMQSVACENFKGGQRDLLVTLDPKNLISETDENNNALSVQFDCKNVAVIEKVSLSGVWHQGTNGGDYSIKSQDVLMEFGIWGQNVSSIKSAVSDNPALKFTGMQKIFEPNSNKVTTDIAGVLFLFPADQAFSGTTKLTFTDSLGFKQTFPVELKLPMLTQEPTITSHKLKGTFSLKNPTITWKTSQNPEATQFAKINDKFISSPAYNISIVYVDPKASIWESISLKDSYSENCSAQFYKADKESSLGSELTCGKFTLAQSDLKQLIIGEKYAIHTNVQDHRDYGNGKTVLESNAYSVMVTIVP